MVPISPWNHWIPWIHKRHFQNLENTMQTFYGPWKFLTTASVVSRPLKLKGLYGRCDFSCFSERQRPLTIPTLPFPWPSYSSLTLMPNRLPARWWDDHGMIQRELHCCVPKCMHSSTLTQNLNTKTPCSANFCPRLYHLCTCRTQKSTLSVR